MKKTISTLAILFFTVTAFCQALKPVKIDSLVTVSLPDTYTKKDTLGQQVFSANSLFGYMVVIRAANAKNNAPLKQEQDLNKVFKDYINGIKGQSDNNASAQNVRDTVIGTLKAKLFTLQTNNEGDIQLRNFALIYTTDATYTFEYGYSQISEDVAKDEYRAYVNSIKFSRNLQRDDQYLLNTKSMSSALKVALIGGACLLIVIIIVFIVKRKKRPALN